MTAQPDRTKPRPVKIVRDTYQPSKAELEEDLRVDATFDEAVRALARPVEIRRTVRPEK